MKLFIAIFGLVSVLCGEALAEQTMLARVTAYWRSEGCGVKASWNGMRLRNGHCAVDPKRIPYGSKVVFPDGGTVTAVDTGPDVVNRRAARASSRNTAQRNAIVIDRFFETRAEARAWIGSHSPFMNVRVFRPNETSRLANSPTPAAGSTDVSHPPMFGSPLRRQAGCEIVEFSSQNSAPRWARRRS